MPDGAGPSRRSAGGPRAPIVRAAFSIPAAPSRQNVARCRAAVRRHADGARRAWENLQISRIVDPRLQAKHRLRQIDAEFKPQLQAAQLAVESAGSRRHRRAATVAMKSLKRERRKARREAQRLVRVPAAW